MRGIVALVVLIVAVLISMPVLADTPIRLPDCVDALEQIVVLRMPVPVYIEEGRFHRDITASKRSSELARLTRITRLSCGKDPIVRGQQDIDAHQLYVARSPECRYMWGRYATMMTPGQGITREEIARHKAIMDEKCPATSLDHHWLIRDTGTVNDPDLVPATAPQ